MRLFEAILATNQRRASGEREARVPIADFEAALPVAALTCIDARLNHLLPDVLGLPEEKFIWLRNAGNIITSPLSSTMRSLALACAVKGAKEIAIIGHTDCQVGKTTTLQLLDRLSALGVDRHRLPANLVEYFGLFGTERQNVLRAVELARSSPLVGTKVPVHGLLLDLATGRVEWIVNGYQPVAAAPDVGGKAGQLLTRAEDAFAQFSRIGHFAGEELKVPDAKIGEIVSTAHELLHRAERVAAAVLPAASTTVAATDAPPPLETAATAEPTRAALRLSEQLRRLAKATAARPPRRR